MQATEIVPIGAITIICAALGMIAKTSPLDDKWIPVAVSLCGAILGAVAMRIMPAFPAGDMLTAVSIGIVSGLASTGAHQIKKQIEKGGGTNE
jgi:Na+/melibiose symporter-like transporter